MDRPFGPTGEELASMDTRTRTAVLGAALAVSLSFPFSLPSSATDGVNCNALASTWVDAHRRTARADRRVLTDKRTAKAADRVEVAVREFARGFVARDLGSYQMGYDIAKRISAGKPLARTWHGVLDPASLEPVRSARRTHLAAETALEEARAAATAKEAAAYRALVKCLGKDDEVHKGP